MARPVTSLSSIQAAVERLEDAVARGLPQNRCLRRWSEFIRERDDHRCVECHATQHLSAHHICRKTFLPEAQYLTGNGITLCRDCHREVHAGFNGRPDLTLPMDQQGGEKLPFMERLYCILWKDAVARDMPHERFYHLSERVLSIFKRFQGRDGDTPFPGPPVQQAYLIWAEAEQAVRRALAEANGVPMTDELILPGEAFIVFDGDPGQPIDSMILRNPRWY